MFTNECLQVSYDNMNKLKVGTLALSHYHQLTRFFLVGDERTIRIMTSPAETPKLFHPSTCCCKINDFQGLEQGRHRLKADDMVR